MNTKRRDMRISQWFRLLIRVADEFIKRADAERGISNQHIRCHSKLRDRLKIHQRIDVVATHDAGQQRNVANSADEQRQLIRRCAGSCPCPDITAATALVLIDFDRTAKIVLELRREDANRARYGYNVLSKIQSRS